MATVLANLQRVSAILGLERPLSLVGSSNVTYRQLLEVANQVADMMAAREGFQGVVSLATWVTVAGSDQGLLTTVVGDDGFQSIVGDKIWDNTNDRVMQGPNRPDEWNQASFVADSIDQAQFRIRGNKLLISPDLAVGTSLKLEYYSKYLFLSAGNVKREFIQADTDTFRLDDRIFRLGVEARWLRTKGLKYEAQQAEFEALVDSLGARDGTSRVIQMDGTIDVPRSYKITPA